MSYLAPSADRADDIVPLRYAAVHDLVGTVSDFRNDRRQPSIAVGKASYLPARHGSNTQIALDAYADALAASCDAECL